MQEINGVASGIDNGPAIRQPVWSDYLRLFTAAALWGSTFLFNEVALDDFSPVAIATYRVSLAAVLLCLICYWRGLQVRLDAQALLLLTAIGVLNSAIPFTLIGWGQLRIDSATTAILLACSPFATLLMSHYMTADDRFSWHKLVGLLFGFSGVCVLIGRGLYEGGGSVAGMLAVVLAACCYSLSSLLIRRLGAMPRLLLVTGSLLAASLVLLPVTLVLYPPWQQSYHSVSLGALVFLAIGPTAIAYVMRAQIVKINGAVFMSTVGYLIPLFAVLWGWLFLGLRPGVHLWLALLLILSGVALGQRRVS